MTDFKHSSGQTSEKFPEPPLLERYIVGSMILILFIAVTMEDYGKEAEEDYMGYEEYMGTQPQEQGRVAKLNSSPVGN